MSTLIMRLIAFIKGEFGAMLRQPQGRRFLLEACLWEAGDAVEAEYRQVEALKQDLETLKGQAGRLRPRVSALESDVDRALAAGMSSIAETLMGRLLPLTRTLEELESGIAQLEVLVEGKESLIDEQEAALLLLRAQSQGLLRGGGRHDLGRGGGVRRDDIQWALEKRRRQQQ